MTRNQPAHGSATPIDPYQLPLTLRDHTLAQTFGLGEPEEKYLSVRVPRYRKGTRLVMFVLLLLLGLVFVGSTIIVWIDHEPGMSLAGNLFLWGIGLLLLISALISSPVWPRIAATYLLCTEGILCHRPLALKQRDLAVLWTQISTYYYVNAGLQIRLIYENEPGGTRHTVSLSSGNPSKAGVSRVGNAILARIDRVLILQAVERFQRGELLSFWPRDAQSKWHPVSGPALALGGREALHLAGQWCLHAQTQAAWHKWAAARKA